MFDKQKPAAASKHPSDVTEDPIEIADAAQHECGNHRIEGLRLEGEILRSTLQRLNRESAAVQPGQ